jgi:hypothetical protein
VAVVVGIAAIIGLAAIQMRHARKVGRERGAVLRSVEDLFTDVTVTQTGIGYPSLRGRWHGRWVKVELVVDTLALRQLPSLYMLVSILRPLPVRTPVDITMRWRPTDIVSAGNGFSYEHVVPTGWPADVRVTTPEPSLPPLEALDDFVEFLEQATTKGLLIAPGGVRVVHALASGAIGQYRVVRRPKFAFTVEPERLETLMRVADAVGDRVEDVGARLVTRA